MDNSLWLPLVLGAIGIFISISSNVEKFIKKIEKNELTTDLSEIEDDIILYKLTKITNHVISNQDAIKDIQFQNSIKRYYHIDLEDLARIKFYANAHEDSLRSIRRSLLSAGIVLIMVSLLYTIIFLYSPAATFKTVSNCLLAITLFAEGASSFWFVNSVHRTRTFKEKCENQLKVLSNRMEAAFYLEIGSSGQSEGPQNE